MNAKVLIEAFGYLGSALVVVSMLMTSVFKLRVINMIGSIIFMIYALIIKSYPTALMNLFLVGINIYHLARLGNTQKHYDLVSLRGKDGYLNYLLTYYAEDIKKYFPEFSQKSLAADADVAYMTCCDSEPAGILIGKNTGDRVELLLDYTTPVYRDCSVGRFLYEKLSGGGIRQLVYSGHNADHIGYVQKMGFEKQEGVYVKTL